MPPHSLLRLLAIAGCLFVANVACAQAIQPEKLTLIDTSRCRYVPVALYKPTSQTPAAPLKLAILSHGYGGFNTEYSFIANLLTARGYLVASIQHEIPGDEPLPLTGEPRVVRRPNWERGVDNIRFVVRALRKLQPTLDFQSLLLLGHSNGGDQSMLYAQTYPKEVAAVISLDNRRMPFPRARRPRVLSIRSSDQKPDEGVLPTPAEQRTYGTLIVPLDILHNDMWDGATPAQKKAITEVIEPFLLLR